MAKKCKFNVDVTWESGNTTRGLVLEETTPRKVLLLKLGLEGLIKVGELWKGRYGKEEVTVRVEKRE